MDEGVMDCRGLERPSRILKKSCCRNLFGARKDDADIRAWLEKQLEEISIKNNERMMEQYGIDLDKNEVVEPNETEKLPIKIMEIQVMSGYYRTTARPDGSASRFFIEFPPPSTKRPLPHISAISPRKKFSLKPSMSTLTSTSTLRRTSTQPTLLGSLTVRKTPSKTPTKTISISASSSPCTIFKRIEREDRTHDERSFITTSVKG